MSRTSQILTYIHWALSFTRISSSWNAFSNIEIESTMPSACVESSKETTPTAFNIAILSFSIFAIKLPLIFLIFIVYFVDLEYRV